MRPAGRQIKIAQYSAYCIGVVLALLPFHALFTTWLGSNFGHLDLFRIWKEISVIALLPGALYLIWSEARMRKWLKNNWLPKLLLFYVLLHFIMGSVALYRGDVNRVALIYALFSNLRFLGFFMIVLAVGSKTDWLLRHWRSLLLIPAIAVIAFGLIQLILPFDFLRHFGYGTNTITAFQTVDQKLTYRRIQSTLRGANPLGAYMLLVFPLFLLVRGKTRRLVMQSAAAIVMFFSYSRSAVLGLLAAAAVLAQPMVRWNKRIIIIVAVCIVFVGGAIFAFRDNNILQNTLFHTDETSRSPVSSNASRLSQTEEAARQIIYEPLGRGPGTAGPASFRNNHPPRIAENYFLQIGQEVGVLGLVIFLVIQILVGRMLWQNRKDNLSRILFALLVGLSVVNLVSHAWADDTLAYLYWGLAALAVAPYQLAFERDSKRL